MSSADAESNNETFFGWELAAKVYVAIDESGASEAISAGLELMLRRDISRDESPSVAEIHHDFGVDGKIALLRFT